MTRKTYTEDELARAKVLRDMACQPQKPSP